MTEDMYYGVILDQYNDLVRKARWLGARDPEDIVQEVIAHHIEKVLISEFTNDYAGRIKLKRDIHERVARAAMSGVRATKREAERFESLQESSNHVGNGSYIHSLSLGFSKLTNFDQKIFIYTAVYGESTREIAERMDSSKSLIANRLIKIRSILKPYFFRG